MRSGKTRSPPSPNVNASGGLPVKTSSGDARSTWRGQQSHAAMMSRWKCIVPFGLPVVPDVNAISAVSSAAVSTLANVSGLRARTRVERRRPVVAVRQHVPQRRTGGTRGVEVGQKARVAQCVRDLAFANDVGQFFRSEQRHRRNHDAAGLEDAEPARRQRRGVRAAQQDAVSGNEAEVVDEHAGDLVGARSELSVRPLRAVEASHGETSAPIAGKRVVEQDAGRIHPGRILELRQLEDQFGPLVLWRQVIARECVDMRTGRHVDSPFSTSRPMISRWTSEAPS